MSGNDHIRTRIDADDKAAGEAVLAELGITTSQALKLFWRQLILHQGLPFDVKVPNAETEAALRENLSGAQRYKSADAMFKDFERDEA